MGTPKEGELSKKKVISVVFLILIGLVLTTCSKEGESPNNVSSIQVTPAVQVHVQLVNSKHVIPQGKTPLFYVGGFPGGWSLEDEVGCFTFNNNGEKHFLQELEGYHYEFGKQWSYSAVTTQPWQSIQLCPN